MTQHSSEDDAFWRLQRWRTIAEEAIDEARQRGEFDDLPGHGKPLALRSNPLAGDWELAFHLLDNAGLLPEWMELDREVATEQQALDRLLAHAGELAHTAPEAGADPPPAWDDVPAFPVRLSLPRFSSRRKQRASAAHHDRERRAPRPRRVEDRARARQRVLDQAARLDAAIVRRNAALPASLAFLERPRYPPERANNLFDAVWPINDPY